MRDSWRKHHGYGTWGTYHRGRAESSVQDDTFPRQRPFHNPTHSALKSNSSTCQSEICLQKTKAVAIGVPISRPSHLTPIPIHVNIGRNLLQNNYHSIKNKLKKKKSIAYYRLNQMYLIFISSFFQPIAICDDSFFKILN